MDTYYNMERMLTDQDVRVIADKPINLIISTDFDDIEHINDLFHGTNDTLILYQNNDENNTLMGHWCALKRLDNNNISFYDSYSGHPDEPLAHIPMKYRKQTGQVINHLRKLLYNSDYNNIHYNPHQHQRYSGNINTCGRHAGLYMRFNLDPEDYNKLLNRLSNITGIKDKDKLVTHLTENLI
jgi:hypothetical protein